MKTSPPRPSPRFKFLLLGALVVSAAAAWNQAGPGTLPQAGPGTFKFKVHDMDRPAPTPVNPGNPATSVAPSDAIVLFNGKDLSAWTKAGSEAPAGWTIKDGILEVAPGTGDIATRQPFGDCQLHIEWSIPSGNTCKGQHGCNSGVFFLSRYELQILESSANVTYVDGMAGSLYGQYPPLVNAARAQGEWNTYDVIFRGPRFDAAAGIVRTATVTAFLNGVLVQDNVELLGATAHGARATYSAHGESGPLKLQDHGDPLQFKNIWIRPLGAPQVAQ